MNTYELRQSDGFYNIVLIDVETGNTITEIMLDYIPAPKDRIVFSEMLFEVVFRRLVLRSQREIHLEGYKLVGRYYNDVDYSVKDL